MTSKNTVLLIVKQNSGIDYNSLLNKISTEYSNINSARAALSRTLKDLLVFGFIVKENNTFFVTDKAHALLSTEMKNKLVIKLNQSVKSSKQENIELVVQSLSTLIERSKQDENLLRAAKTSSEFFIQDLQDLADHTEKKITQLQYLEKILLEQIKTLKELNFNDQKKISFSKSKEIVQKLVEENQLEEIVIEIYRQNLKELFLEKLSVKFKENIATIKKEMIQEFFSVLEKQEFNPHEVVLFLPPVKAKIGSSEAFFIGPFFSISKI